MRCGKKKKEKKKNKINESKEKIFRRGKIHRGKNLLNDFVIFNLIPIYANRWDGKIIRAL